MRTVYVLWHVRGGLCRHIGHSNYALSTPSHVVRGCACEFGQVGIHLCYYGWRQVCYRAEYLLEPLEGDALTQPYPFLLGVAVGHSTSARCQVSMIFQELCQSARIGQRSCLISAI